MTGAEIINSGVSIDLNILYGEKNVDFYNEHYLNFIWNLKVILRSIFLSFIHGMTTTMLTIHVGKDDGGKPATCRASNKKSEIIQKYLTYYTMSITSGLLVFEIPNDMYLFNVHDEINYNAWINDLWNTIIEISPSMVNFFGLLLMIAMSTALRQEFHIQNKKLLF